MQINSFPYVSLMYTLCTLHVVSMQCIQKPEATPWVSKNSNFTLFSDLLFFTVIYCKFMGPKLICVNHFTWYLTLILNVFWCCLYWISSMFQQLDSMVVCFVGCGTRKWIDVRHVAKWRVPETLKSRLNFQGFGHPSFWLDTSSSIYKNVNTYKITFFDTYISLDVQADNSFLTKS